MMSKLVPKLRFKEFSGEWEEKRFKDLTKINQGLQIPISERYNEKVKDSYFYITNEFLKKSSEKQYFIKNPSESVLCTEKDILMTRTGNTGQIVTNVNGAFHNNFFKIKYDERMVKDFLVYFLKSAKTQNIIMSLAGSSTIPDLNHEDFYRIKIQLPKPPEQQKIASCLSSLDNLIEAQNKKVEALKKHKKGLMQQLFPKEGEKVPTLRFDGFSGEWEEKKLDSVGEIVTGTTPSTKKEEYYADGIYPWVTPTDITEKKDIFETKKSLTKDGLNNSRFVPKNSMLVTCIASIGKNTILREDGSCNQQINAITPYEQYNVDFLYYLIEEKNYILKENAGQGGMAMLNKSDFSNLKFTFPLFKEQQKIASCLSSLDNLIEAQNKKVEALKKHKKGLMQQMFVSGEN